MEQALRQSRQGGVGVVVVNLGSATDANALPAVERFTAQLPELGPPDVDGERIRLLVRGSMSDLVAVAEAVRRNLTETPDSAVRSIVLSIGLTVARPEDNAARLLRRADAMLPPTTVPHERKTS